VAALSDEEDEVREEAPEALGVVASAIKDKSDLKVAKKPLKKAQKDDAEGVREYARKASRPIRAK
jgi:hypothetical protein